MAIPIISDLLERLFGSSKDPHSRDDVKRRLQIVLAHDRLALDPQTLEMMRQEIIAVVSRYVEVDFDSLEFSLATDQRVTALTANLPIKRIRPLGRGPDQPIHADDEVKRIELASPTEASALDAKEAEAALRKFEENCRNEPELIHSPLDIDRPDLTDDAGDALDPPEEIEASEEESNRLDQAEYIHGDEPPSRKDGSDSDESDSDESGSDALNVPDMSIPDATAKATSRPKRSSK